MRLLYDHYSDRFAIYVFQQFKPSFIKSNSLKRRKYLRIVSNKMLIWIYNYNDNDTGKGLNSDELKFYFTSMKKYLTANNNMNEMECKHVLSSITHQIIEKIPKYIIQNPEHVYFVFIIHFFQ